MQRRIALLPMAIALAGLAAHLFAVESNLGPPAGVAPLAIPFFIDRRLPRDLRASVEEAHRRLTDSRCQEILTDFADSAGRRLDVNLASTGETAASYLGLVLFYDGRATERCADRHVLAWTAPGSRAVHICWDQFSLYQRFDKGYAADTLIHETLHTLGLGENPPEPRMITAQVIARCGR